ncbi:xanthine dehydrogenase family protein molybdopterin-binding subunit [Paraburkholderia oxyphila]|uniref:xanthine dehydrogenase family protein molybdopterin-binding subunit n=1 Tax=Paraburkholderia oxyphila TaxID=614212 RepID=UPI000484AA9A|nr:molybdopterin cofactor-binding domain-containing protein [Paraburkholderia oxyphila]
MTTRRQFLKTGGGLAISFTLPLSALSWASSANAVVSEGPAARDAPAGGKSQDAARVSAWLAIDKQGDVTLYAGKVELGTGVQTALAQLVAEELEVPVDRVIVLMGDTATAVDQGPTVGSMTMKTSTLPVRRAAATARSHIVTRASALWGVAPGQLATRAGHVYERSNLARSRAYADVLPEDWTSFTVDETVALKPSSGFSVIGTAVPRVELPAKVNGSHIYLQNIRLPNMVHARVIHPPIDGATLSRVDRKSVEKMPGFIDMIVKGNFVAVVCEEEFQAVLASRALALALEWSPRKAGVDSAHVYDAMRSEHSVDEVLRTNGNPDRGNSEAVKRLVATYRAPYQTHGSIGPSCGLADVKADSATVWSATQGSFPLRDAIAELIGLPREKVRVVWTEGAGCYGHNGADDASAEAAFLSQALKRPVRVQWMRNDEHGWDPKGPATEAQIQASLDAEGNIGRWIYTISTPTHISRPMGSAGNLLPGRLMGRAPKPVRIGGDHCARTLYRFANERVTVRWLPDGPLRPSALRGLGAVANTFANESSMDELARLAERDPIDFRLAHLTDERAKAVLQEARRISNWNARRAAATQANAAEKEGVGVALARLEPGGAYVAAVCCVAVNAQTGETRVSRVFVAHDCGLIVNPDGLRNQIQGCVVQTISRTMKEEFRFSATAMLTLDWASYPILRFSECPQEVQISLINREDQPPVGAGEPTALTIAPAIGNAIFHATGVRIRKTPFTASQFKASQKG